MSQPTAPNSPGLFIALEGGDGVGKSTQIAGLTAALEALTGRSVVTVREPGATALGLELRRILLDRTHGETVSGETELLLFSAARRHLLDQVVLPALRRGDIVLSDRFALSTYVYQGTGRGVAFESIDAVTAVAVGEHMPDATVVLTLAVEGGMARLASAGAARDAFESDTELVARAHANYVTAANRVPNSIVVSAEGTPAAVTARIMEALRPLILSRMVPPRVTTTSSRRSR